jgi:hypothetical protein
LDLSSAFDTVDHPTLLSVLNKRFCVSGCALSWFQSYLTNRTQSLLYAGKQTAPIVVDCGVPQGSVQGPFQFICYTEDVCNVFDRHGVNHHLFADDMQIYVSGTVDTVNLMRQQLADCCSDTATWCAARRLQLNGVKSDLSWLGSKANLRKLSGHDVTITVGSAVVRPSSVVRDLGVQLDEEVSMKQHVSLVARTGFHHLRRLRRIRRHVGEHLTTQLVLALVISRLDYCNTVLAGLPSSTTAPLQRVQNAAARLVFDLRPRDHVTPALIQLHWLPVQSRITYKLCVLMYQAHTGVLPAYLNETLNSCQNTVRRPGLRSASTLDFTTPRLRSKFGERAFSFAGPHAWNSLPSEIRSAENIDCFKRKLKTHLFSLAFNLPL